ncbi:MAG: ISAs1 family transposase [Chloroflexi bacterium]|nr:ISAs1 family transposase [Chloroflexota bacterium]
MDPLLSPSLLEYLQGVPDPRHARGKQFEWLALLTIICAALVSGQKTVRAVAHWATLHAQELLTSLALRRIPSVATLYRALRRVDLAALEHQIASYGQAVAEADPAGGRMIGPTGEVWYGQAVDGKTLRGASAHGETVAGVSLVRHGSGVVVAEVPVPPQTNEIPVVQGLLAGQDLTGTVTTLDALHTRRDTARVILRQGGDYVMFVKRNQPELWQAIDLLFHVGACCCPGGK